MTPAELPEHLAERCVELLARPPARAGRYVLYWMHHACRDHENPALDVALCLAERLQRPLLVYQGLGGRHRFQNDRQLWFIAQGALETQRQLAERGVRHVLWWPTRASERSPLRRLLAEAAAAVFEDYPAPPFPAWTRALLPAAAGPVYAVDAFCLIPLRSHGRAYGRAFEFRAQNRAEFERRVGRAYPEWTGSVSEAVIPLDFEGFDGDALALAERIAAAEIDHSIGPVAHTPGGSTAGYARWTAFRDAGLARYAELRNDAAVRWPLGVSRMSAYLHHGQVAPFRIAREAAAQGSPGADKFLDELLIWRELAFNFCLHEPDPERLEALPAWARRTLSEHAHDPRATLVDDEALARAQSPHPLWNLAQRSLLQHGELHNNLRMTWGKALLGWSRSAEQALARLVELNHRYALDGSDPNSYGGLLWCLGLFDRPHPPPRPVEGLLRARPLDAHARRLDLEAYRDKIAPPASGRPWRVAIVGAGIAGAAAARTLSDHGHHAVLYDKGRGAGGRGSTRRVGPWSFDHGVQSFTARDDRFARWLPSWQQRGVILPWRARVMDLQSARASHATAARYVGRPGMSALVGHLLAGAEVHFGIEVAALDAVPRGYRLVDRMGVELGTFDAVLLAVPPAQAARLLPPRSPLRKTVAAVEMAPIWALMVAFEDPLPWPWEAAVGDGGAFGWLARSGSKPGRQNADAWVMHAGEDWSAAHLEDSAEAVSAAMLIALFERLGIEPRTPAYVAAHRWRYARARRPLGRGALVDRELRLAVAGDWCVDGRLEGAYLSGVAAAQHLITLATGWLDRSLSVSVSVR